MSIRFGITRYGVIAGLGLLASGAVAGSVTTAMVTSDPATVNETTIRGTTTASGHTPLTLNSPLRCSIYDPGFVNPLTTLQVLLHEDQFIALVADGAIEADNAVVVRLDEQVHLPAALARQRLLQ